MKAIIALFAFLFTLSFNFHAQTQGIAYPAVGKGVATTFVTDYHSLGINSSALGWGNEYNKKFTTGSSEFNLGIYSDSLNSDKLKALYKSIRQTVTDKETDTAGWQAQRQYAMDYLNSGIAFDMSFNWAGFSFQSEKLGGFAFNISENYSWYSRFNDNTTDLIFNGRVANYFDSLTVVFGTDTSRIANSASLSDDTLNAVIQGTASVPLGLREFMNGTEIRFAWNRYYNFGYGRKVFGKDSTFVLYAGIGGRFIQSMAMFNAVANDDEFYVYSSFNSNYDIDYGAAASGNPSAFTSTGNIPKPVGTGYGIDLSASAIIFNKLKVAAAVNNIGSVTYTRNVYSVNDTLVASMELAGLGNYNITNSVYNLLEDGGVISLEGEEKYTLKNAATYRLGASFELGRVRVGMDVVGPFDRDNPGSLTNPVVSVGGDVRVFKWLRLSAGYLGGGLYKHNVPVGINFAFGGGTYEFGVSSRDALTFFLDGSNSVSTAFGFARFRF
ncbi:MAG: hypothetical protein HWE22_11025 [Flavobacteriales bacterium]|nr:hypothetical protein [Flavobacteriales bacterium]